MTTPPRPRQTQAEQRAAWRNESVLNRQIRLGFPPAPGWVEQGLSVAEYYRRKFARGEHSQYWGLHITEDYARRRKSA